MATTYKHTDLFRRFSKENKNKIIDSLTDEQVLRIPESDLIKMIKKVGTGKKGSPNKTLYLKVSEPGNHWNSNVDSVYVWKKKLWLNFYVQYGDHDTDGNFDNTWSEFMRYTEFRGQISGEDYYGNPKTYYYAYDRSDKVEVIRSILKNYVEDL